MNIKDLYLQAIGTYGVLHQKKKAVEELGELIVALARDNDFKNITEEIADVLIMLEQLMIIYNNEDLVAQEKVKKLERLQRRLEDINV